MEKNPKVVLLSREQYETLLRDAKRDRSRSRELQPPVRAVISAANYTGRIEGGALHVHAEMQLDVLSDQWAEVPFAFATERQSLGELKLDDETALRPAARGKGKEKTARLLVRGRGAHKLSADFSMRIEHRQNGRSAVGIGLPRAAATSLALELPPNVEVWSDKPLVKKASAQATSVTLISSAGDPSVSLEWWPIGTGESGGTSTAALSQKSSFLYFVDAERVRADLGVVLTAALGKLPGTFTARVSNVGAMGAGGANANGAKVLQVEGAEVSKWSLDGDTVTIELTPGERTATAFRVIAEAPSLGTNASGAVAFPMLEIGGVTRVSGAFAITGSAGVNVREVAARSLVRQGEQLFDPLIEKTPFFIAAYTFATPLQASAATVSRIAPRFDADLDTLAQFQPDAIFIERTLTLRETEGEIFDVAIDMPADEEILSIQRADGTEPDWATSPTARSRLVIRWSERLAAGTQRKFKIRTRIEPTGWTELPQKGTRFLLGDAWIENAENVTGYIALKADASFRLQTEAADGLEARDGRQTPVRGDFAWFRRRNFLLQTLITKRAPEIQAGIIGYALPRENALEIHTQIDFAFLYSGVKRVRIQVPAEHAHQFYFDGENIAERNLGDGGEWTILFQKEITGSYSLKVSAQLPVEKKSGTARVGTAATFNANVPVIAPLDVQRVGGVWAVEANTETEISFESSGMNELDTLLAPALADYKPQHRVIGVFNYLGTNYSLALSGVRHEPAQALTTIVDQLDLTSVLATSGAERHQATFTLRTAGDQFLDVELPKSSKIWSLAVDEELVKPVAENERGVRVQLPAKLDPASAMKVSLVYETQKTEWRGSGAQELIAPKLAPSIPVLQSRWRVFLPEGFSYRAMSGNLPQKAERKEPVLLSLLAERTFGPLGAMLRPMAALKESSHREIAAMAQPTPAASMMSEGRAQNEVAIPTARKPVAKPASQQQQFGFSTAGLLPMKIELPLTGEAFLFEGFYAPENVRFRYVNWWREARVAWIWFVVGAVAFWFLGAGRPWWAMLWGTLLLTFAPMCVWPAATVACNAILAGWLVAFVLHRIATWFVFRPQPVESPVT